MQWVQDCSILLCLFCASNVVILNVKRFTHLSNNLSRCAQALCGITITVIRNFPPFNTHAALAGIIWSTGNVLTVPIINTLGGGLGILMWGSIQVIVGWSSGRFASVCTRFQRLYSSVRFGFLGPKPEVPKSDLLEYIGVGLTLISAILLSLVRPSANQARDKVDLVYRNILLQLQSLFLGSSRRQRGEYRRWQ